VQIEVNRKKLFSQVAVRAYPFLPDRPVYPYYLRDAGISVAASFLLALLSVWFYDFMNRPARRAAVADIHTVFVSTPERSALPQVTADRLPYAHAPQALEQQLPRELAENEVLAQLEAADPDTRLLTVCLLSGLTTEEIKGLHWGDIDLDSDTLHIHNQQDRMLVISPPLRAAITDYRPPEPDPAATVWQDAGGEALSDNDLEALIACAAHDAGLTRPSEVSAKTFLHTYIAYLVRRGVKLSDLDKVVGTISPTVLAAYGVFSPPGSALPLDSIETVYPALQRFFKTQTSKL
jgi:integrase